MTRPSHIVRSALLALALVLPAAPPARALDVVPVDPGRLTVDAFTQTIESAHFRIQFDLTRPDMVGMLIFKDRDPYRDLASEENTQTEFFGQDMRGTASRGSIDLPHLVEINWQVDARSDRAAQISTRTVSDGRPPVLTRYWFYGDRPWFVVERTILYSEVPYTGSYQDFVPRVGFYDTYRAMRYRDTNGALQQRGYCATPCVTEGWDGRWLQQVGYRLGLGQSVATIYPNTVPAGQRFVRGYGPNTWAGWAAPLWDSTAHTADETHRMIVAFSTQPDSIRQLDSLWTAFSSGAVTLDAPTSPAAPAAALQLSLGPNPSHGSGPVHVAWSLPHAQHARVEVLDVSGRRVATLFDGEAPAGGMRETWSGREAQPGLYWARLTTAAGVLTKTIVRMR
ncbi:MAG: hypothetical protein HZA61_16105 [Candidatus Eisenbacteria bacterium]|uniref:T9SS type A sorting domain-containing protein n=1 Tax=Eiseniibacteriota bacterium TaxID=2212470 RepID=A0A933W3C7_UNCEI|nr:hypothetical protein [Candidatus Eisenbacteria bacterium]